MLAILFGLILGFVHFFSRKIHPIRRMKTVSFLAGIFITYLFLHMFPMLYEETEFLVRVSLIWVVVGFSFFHVIEKYLYKHDKSTRVLRKDLKEIHTIGFFLYHFVIGFILVDFLSISILDGLLFFIPLLFFSALSTISMKELHGKIRENTCMRILLSGSTLIGIILAIYISIPSIVFDVLLGFVIGTALHTILMDAIPKERRGKPEYFILGVIVYTLLIGLAWFL